MSVFHSLLAYLSNVIQFKDINVKQCLLSNSTINSDGTKDITYTEANAVTDGSIIKTAINPDPVNNPNTDIVSFEEFEYFKNIDNVKGYTFAGCSNLKYIKFPTNSLNNAGIQTQPLNHNVKILDGTAVEVLHLENQNSIISFVWSIDQNSKFGSTPNLKEVWIPNVTKLAGQAFTKQQQPNIEKIIIGSINQWLSMEMVESALRPSISGKASLYLISDIEHPITDITTLTEPIEGRTTVPTVFRSTFDGLQNLKTITIGAPHTHVESNAFTNLPDTVTILNFDYIETVTPGCFQNCKAKGMNSFPSSITAVGEFDFRYSALEQLISDNLLTISGSNSFSNSALKIVSIDYCTINGNASFVSCPNLTYISANSLTTIPVALCTQCSKLQTVRMLNATIIKQGAFSRCSNLTTVETSPNVTKVETEAFYYCSKLTESSLTFDISLLEYIGSNAFSRTNKISCPTEFPNLTFIGNGAFSSGYYPSGGYVVFSANTIVEFGSGGSHLEDVNYSINTFGSYGTPITKIYVPDGSLEIDGVTKTYKEWYEEDINWAKFLYYNPSVSFDTINHIPT
jgi:hypothetical protein